MLENVKATEPSKAVLIFGSTRGIGFELARVFASNGWVVVGVGRSYPEQPISNGYHHFIADAMTMENTHSLVELVRRLGYPIKGVINCVGFAQISSIFNTTTENIHKQIQINLTAVILMVKAVTPLIDKNDGRIFFLGSRARRYAFLGGASYCAAKAGLYALSDCLALEFKDAGWNISSTVYEIGPVATGFGGVEINEQQIPVSDISVKLFEDFCAPNRNMITRVVEIVPSIYRIRGYHE